MLSWIIMILGLGTTWYCSDVSSPSSLYNMVCPVLFFVFLISLIVKVVLWMHRHNMSSDSGGGDFFSGGDNFGGDSGGGGGGD